MVSVLVRAADGLRGTHLVVFRGDVFIQGKSNNLLCLVGRFLRYHVGALCVRVVDVGYVFYASRGDSRGPDPLDATYACV